MSWPADAIGLLAGPRGRRLCFELVSPFRDYPRIESYPGWRDLQYRPGGVDRRQLAAELSDLVAGADLTALAATAAENALAEPFADSVAAARYWQPPDEIDQSLADPLMAGLLAPVAQAVTAAPAAQWWSAPLDRDSQQYVQFLSDQPGGSQDRPEFNGASARLADWLARTVADERDAASRPADPAAAYSGFWWSTPALSLLVSTTSSVPGLGAIGLTLVEDAQGWTEARCWPVRCRADVRVHEIRGSEDWTELVARYPLEVTRSRWHDWWRATGRAGTWLIPDFEAVAADYDAVHLTAGGYLTTAGRALPVGVTDEVCTVLAGWDPDKTYWLTDVLEQAGPAARWENTEEEPLAWALAPDPDAS